MGSSMRGARKVDERLLFDNHKRVVKETLRYDNGDEDEWVYIDTPKSAMIIALTPEEDLVFVRLYRHNLKGRFAELPAGIVETQDKEAALHGAARELREETGYEAKEMVYLGKFYALPSETNRWTHYFLALQATRVQDPKYDDLIEKYFEMSCELVPFSSVQKTDKAIELGFEGVESLFGIRLASDYLASKS